MRSYATVVVTAAVLWTFPANAQTAAPPAVVVDEISTKDTTVLLVKETPKEHKWGREMGGHFFMPSHLIDDPFSYTAFGMTFGLGSGSALGPELHLSPPPPVITDGTKWYGYTGLGVGFIQNVRFLEYLSARLLVNTTAYLGTGSGAVIAVGSSARVTGDVGVKGSLPVGKNFRFAATFDISYGPVYSLLIAEGIKAAFDACRVDPQTCNIDLGSFLAQEDTVTYIGGLSGAWAPLPFLGIILNAQFIAPTKTGKASVSQNGYTLAATVDFDARPLVRWLPLGMNLTYSITSPIGSSGVTTTQDYGVGLYYTGMPDLALGLELDWRNGRLSSQQVSESTLAWINFRYYWN